MRLSRQHIGPITLSPTGTFRAHVGRLEAYWSEFPRFDYFDPAENAKLALAACLGPTVIFMVCSPNFS